MGPAEFRRLALALPEAREGEHMGHADFRVRDKIFATLGPDETWAMLKLTPELQAARIDADPDVFAAFPGAWGARGATQVQLAAARKAVVASALRDAWRTVAPRKLVDEHDAR